MSEVAMMNWFGAIFIIPATLLLIGSMISKKLKKEQAPTEISAIMILIGAIALGLIRTNIDGENAVLRWVLLAVELLLLVVYFWRLRRIWKQLFLAK